MTNTIKQSYIAEIEKSLKRVEAENVQLKQTLEDRNKLDVAVFVNGTHITVIGVYDQSKAGGQARGTVENFLKDNESCMPSTINYKIATRLQPNVTEELPRA